MTRPPRTSPLFPYTTLFRSITIRAGTTARVGLFVSREQQRAGESQIEAEVAIARPNDPGKNGLQWHAMKRGEEDADRKSTRLNSSHPSISYAVFCLKKKTKT